MAKNTEVNLSDYFYYDEESPSCVRWKTDLASKNGAIRKFKNKPTGNKNKLGYYRVKLFGREYLCHRIVAELNTGIVLTTKQIVDHRDRNPSNNKFDNLRIVSNSINRRNMKQNRNNTSGVTGVSISNCKKYWVASCRDLNQKSIYGCYSIQEFGDKLAFDLACEKRKSMVEELNKDGAGYSETHGVDNA